MVGILSRQVVDGPAALGQCPAGRHLGDRQAGEGSAADGVAEIGVVKRVVRVFSERHAAADGNGAAGRVDVAGPGLGAAEVVSETDFDQDPFVHFAGGQRVGG